MRRLSLVFVALGLLACAPDPLEGHFSCTSDAECPDGWSCRADRLCYSTPGEPRDAGALDAGPPIDASDVPTDAGVDAGGADGGECLPATSEVDLLFMIDSSQSMVEEQRQFASTFPALVATLITGDIDGDGIADFPPLSSLHVGVVTSDMGTGGFLTPGCSNDPMFGEDARLRTDGDVTDPSCAAVYPSFIDYMAPGGQAQLTRDMSCLVTNRRNGCGFEQQLEAVLKAVTPATSPVRFFDASVGHGDGVNAGFLRPSSVFVSVLISDEDDCSAQDPDLYNFASMRYTANPNLRCMEYPDALRPVSRYVQGLARLRPTQRTLFAALVGIPEAIQGDTYDSILAHPDMAYRDDGTSPTPSCARAGSTVAYPGRRYVEVARDLETEGVGTVIHSICQADYQPTWTAILQELASRSLATCD